MLRPRATLERSENMSDDNTKPEFFALWSLRQLQVECARLNKLIKEVSEAAEKALEGAK
jgi:hypothetical protein